VDSTSIKVHQAGRGSRGGSRIKSLALPKTGTIPGSPRQLMNGHASSLCSSSPPSAPKRRLPNNCYRFWPRPWSSFGSKASIQTNCGIFSRQMPAWLASCLVPTKPAVDGTVRNSTASDTWSKTSFSGSGTGAVWRPAMRKSLQPSSRSRLSHAPSITYEDHTSTRPRRPITDTDRVRRRF
jgi:hypothetical protein